MAPGALSMLAPLLGRGKAKKYEKLETEDPERRRQEATQEEMNRLNLKIERLKNSMSRDSIEKADTPEEECVVCCHSRAVMQVSPCGHQCQCRLCFVHTIQEAVARRDLPLRCLVCSARILRVKNNSLRRPAGTNPSAFDHPVHSVSKPAMPKSVSGYSLGHANSNGMAHSASNYSMSSGVSSMSTSSWGSTRSAKSSTSLRSDVSASAQSWFSLGSLSNFQAGGVVNSSVFAKAPPRAHSLSSTGKTRPRPPPPKSLPTSSSAHSLRSATITGSSNSRTPSAPGVNGPSPCSAVVPTPQAILISPEVATGQIMSPSAIDSRIRAIQGYVRVPAASPTKDPPNVASIQQQDVTLASRAAKSRLQATRDAFRGMKPHAQQEACSHPSVTPPPMQHSVTAERQEMLRRRLMLSGDRSQRAQHSRKFPSSKSTTSATASELAETTFTMTTIEEELETSSILEPSFSQETLASAD